LPFEIQTPTMISVTYSFFFFQPYFFHNSSFVLKLRKPYLLMPTVLCKQLKNINRSAPFLLNIFLSFSPPTGLRFTSRSIHYSASLLRLHPSSSSPPLVAPPSLSDIPLLLNLHFSSVPLRQEIANTSEKLAFFFLPYPSRDPTPSTRHPFVRHLEIPGDSIYFLFSFLAPSFFTHTQPPPVGLVPFSPFPPSGPPSIPNDSLPTTLFPFSTPFGLKVVVFASSPSNTLRHFQRRFLPFFLRHTLPFFFPSPRFSRVGPSYSTCRLIITT